ncbi:MAG: RHS repeat-associated core domain-containing protein, partial [Proteobacteria bacterium]
MCWIIVSRSNNNDSYAWTLARNQSITYSTNSLNQYGTVQGLTTSYDSKQNTSQVNAAQLTFGIENTVTTGGDTSYWHDALNRLTFITSKSLRFDWDGDTLVGIYQGAAPLRRFAYAPGENVPVVWYEGAGTSEPRYYDLDERGSVTRVRHLNDISIRINSYDEYGVPGPNNLGRFQYSGYIWLPEIGMYYTTNRIYAPSIGRFLQPDPIGVQGGGNLYGYVGNNPINRADPLGLAPYGPTMLELIGLAGPGPCSYATCADITARGGDEEILVRARHRFTIASIFGGGVGSDFAAPTSGAFDLTGALGQQLSNLLSQARGFVSGPLPSCPTGPRLTLG